MPVWGWPFRNGSVNASLPGCLSRVGITPSALLDHKGKQEYVAYHLRRGPGINDKTWGAVPARELQNAASGHVPATLTQRAKSTIGMVRSPATSHEKFIDELPEGVGVFARLLRHGEGPAAIAHEQPRDDHGYWCGQMQGVRKGIEPHGQGEGKQHFDLVIVQPRPVHCRVSRLLRLHIPFFRSSRTTATNAAKSATHNPMAMRVAFTAWSFSSQDVG